MTSGTFASVNISKIWVDRATRQRRELTGIPELATSIKSNGLINPPVVRKSTYELIAGERRWEACKSLGWTAMPVQWAEDLPEHELKAIELEENIRRIELPWQDQCRAVQEYHKIRLDSEPEWNQTKTAAALGYSKEAVSHILNVAQELAVGNPALAKADKFSEARNIVIRQNERKQASVLAAIAEKPKSDAPILTQNFLEWKHEGAPFNLIHCDFPYGINADNQDQGVNVGAFGGYEDSRDTYLTLIERLRYGMDEFIAESAHLIFWFAMEHYFVTWNCLTGMGWKVNPYPLIWWKSDNSGLLPDPARGPRRVYETAFMASRGDRKIISAVSNLKDAPTTKLHHMSEKPINILSHFFRMVVDEYTSILDPTCGSGNALIAAKKMGAPVVLGLEVNEEFAERVRQNWRSHFD